VRQHRDQAYVLGTTELGEADLIVTLLAENTGRLRGVAPSARKSRKRFGGRLEPLTRVVVTWAQREGRDLHRIESLETLRSFAAMQADPAKQAACAVLAEITGHVVHEERRVGDEEVVRQRDDGTRNACHHRFLCFWR